MEFPRQIGVMVLGECTLFPQAVVPLFIFEPRYRAMLADALEGHRLFCVAMRRPDDAEEHPRDVAGLGVVRTSYTHDNGTSNILVQGLTRVRLGRRVRSRPYRVHEIEPLVAETKESLLVDALCARAMDLIEARLRLAADGGNALLKGFAGGAGEAPGVEECLAALRSIDDAAQLADFAAASLLTDPESRQGVLEAVEVEERLRRLVRFLTGEIPGSEPS